MASHLYSTARPKEVPRRFQEPGSSCLGVLSTLHTQTEGCYATPRQDATRTKPLVFYGSILATRDPALPQPIHRFQVRSPSFSLVVPPKVGVNRVPVHRTVHGAFHFAPLRIQQSLILAMVRNNKGHNKRGWKRGDPFGGSSSTVLCPGTSYAMFLMAMLWIYG